MTDTFIYFVLLAIDKSNPDCPNVVGLYENRDEALEDCKRFRKTDFWSDYIVRAGIVIHDKKKGN